MLIGLIQAIYFVVSLSTTIVNMGLPRNMKTNYFAMEYITICALQEINYFSVKLKLFSCRSSRN